MRLFFIVVAYGLAPSAVFAGSSEIDGGEGLKKCLDLHNARARLACYDNAAGYAPKSQGRVSEILSSTPSSSANLDNPTPEELEKQSETDFGLEQTRRKKEKEKQKALESIGGTVAKLSKRPRREIVVELENGQVWTQTSPRFLTIRVGDEVVIKRARLGGYILTTSRGGSSRVKRLP